MYNKLAAPKFISKNNEALLRLKEKHGYKPYSYHALSFEFADRFRKSASTILKPKVALELEKFLCEDLLSYGGILQTLEDQRVPNLGICFEALHGLHIFQIYADGELKLRRNLMSSNSLDKDLSYELSSIVSAVELPTFTASGYGRYQFSGWFPKRNDLLNGIKDIISKKAGPMIIVRKRHASTTADD